MKKYKIQETRNKQISIFSKQFSIVLALFTVFLFLVSSNALAQELPEAFVGPGGCTTKEECREYCDEDENKEECLNFALEKGLMTEDEVEKARKFLNQTGPGGCQGDECRDYCEDPANTEECIKFAEENGLIKPGEGERFRKMREIAERGGPGGCKGEECRDYCEDEAHEEECIAFAKENGLLNEEQLQGIETGKKIKERIKTTGGPGGCKSEDECHKYCFESGNIDECAAFGAEATGKSPEEMKRMLEEFKRGGGRDFGPDDDFRMRREEFDQRRREFEGRLNDERGLRERMMREGFGAPEGFRPPEGESFEGAGQSFMGPGGCNSPDSCRAYCMSNPQACGYGGGMPPQGMPGEYREGMMPGEGFQLQYEGGMMPPEGYEQYQAPPPESQPTSYDHSRSFLSNLGSAFLAPFRK